MDKISCDICMDLIPLVKDGIASEDSCDAVTKHISKCEKCKVEFDEIKEKKKINNEDIKINDKKIISKIKNQLIRGAIIMIVLGSFIGVGISESEWMFYNIVIMPIIGGVGYFIFRKKSYILPISIFTLTYVWDFIKYMVESPTNKMGWREILTVPATWATIYTGLCTLGILIGFLLYIAFKKEGK